jgi:putative endonuclease
MFSGNLAVSANIHPMFYVYILQSMKDLSFYIGQCEDLDNRLSKHFDGMSKYTSGKRPLKLRYFEVFPTRKEALFREKQIKKMKSRIYIQQLIEKKLTYWLMKV